MNPTVSRHVSFMLSCQSFVLRGLERIIVFPTQVWFVGVCNSSWLSLAFATVSVLVEAENCLLRAGCSSPQRLNWDVCGVSVRFWDWDTGQLL